MVLFLLGRFYAFVSGREFKVRNIRTRKTRRRLQESLATHKAQKQDTRSVRRLLKPLHIMSEAVRRIRAEGRFDQPLPIQGSDEIGTLAGNELLALRERKRS